MLISGRWVNAAKHGLDIMRIFTGDKTLESVFHHGTGNITGNRDTVAFTDTLDSIVGSQFDNYPERAANACRGHCNPGFDISKFHDFTPRESSGNITGIQRIKEQRI